MKKRNNPYFYWGVTAFCVLLACIIAFLLLSHLNVVFNLLDKFLSGLAPVLYGLAIGYLICPLLNLVERPLNRWLQRKLKKQQVANKLSRAGGIVFALGVAILVVYAVIAMILPELTESVIKLVRELPENYQKAANWISGVLVDNPALADAVSGALKYIETWLYNELLPNAQNYLLSLTSSMFGILSGVLNLVIGLIVSIYVLVSKDVFLAQSKKIICAVLPAKRANRLMDIGRYAHKTFGGFLSGKIFDSLIIGILCFVGMSVMKLPYTLLVSVIVGVTNIVPFFGPYIGAIPSAFLILLVNPMQCLYFVIFIFVLQQFDGNILGPHILGNATGLSGFWVVVSILAFGNLFGLVGMIIGVPAFAVFYSLVADAINQRLKRKGIRTDQNFLELYHIPDSLDEAEKPKDSQ